MRSVRGVDGSWYAQFRRNRLAVFSRVESTGRCDSNQSRKRRPLLSTRRIGPNTDAARRSIRSHRLPPRQLRVAVRAPVRSLIADPDESSESPGTTHIHATHAGRPPDFAHRGPAPYDHGRIPAGKPQSRIGHAGRGWEQRLAGLLLATRRKLLPRRSHRSRGWQHQGRRRSDR